MQKAIIIFRYHKAFDVCTQKLSVLRQFNPGIEIHGLFGGNKPLSKIPPSLTSQLDSNWKIPSDDKQYKWMHGDLCVRSWFEALGHQLDFDHAYFLEWDMLFLKPLTDVYGPLEKDKNYATIFGSFYDAEQMPWYWFKESYSHETAQLLDMLNKSKRRVVIEELYFSTMGCAVFCRKFLELYSAEPIPAYSNDEVRYSIYSKAFGIPLIDNRIMVKAKAGENFYNVDNHEAKNKDITDTIKNNGDVIHPVRKKIKNLEKKLGLSPTRNSNWFN